MGKLFTDLVSKEGLHKQPAPTQSADSHALLEPADFPTPATHSPAGAAGEAHPAAALQIDGAMTPRSHGPMGPAISEEERLTILREVAHFDRTFRLTEQERTWIRHVVTDLTEALDVPISQNDVIRVAIDLARAEHDRDPLNSPLARMLRRVKR